MRPAAEPRAVWLAAVNRQFKTTMLRYHLVADFLQTTTPARSILAHVFRRREWRARWTARQSHRCSRR
ncbi:hypothetical protein BCAR13_790071 [Paraburkholderia caribensis]|nr:hypothetical protein BCAR13_790071 [Paraburkholderia caribensis]